MKQSTNLNNKGRCSAEVSLHKHAKRPNDETDLPTSKIMHFSKICFLKNLVYYLLHTVYCKRICIVQQLRL